MHLPVVGRKLCGTPTASEHLISMLPTSQLFPKSGTTVHVKSATEAAAEEKPSSVMVNVLPSWQLKPPSAGAVRVHVLGSCQGIYFKLP